MNKRFLVATMCFSIAACGGGEPDAGSADVSSEPGVPAVSDTGSPAAAAGAVGDSATAVMQDTTGRNLGTLVLQNSGEGIVVRGRLTGLAPGAHGIHLHTTGRCEPDFEAAGGHWNPTNNPHGRPGNGHLGDMENITVGADSTVLVSVQAGSGASLRGNAAPHALLDSDGAAVMVHAGADDYQSQPSGDSGARVACGVVQG